MADDPFRSLAGALRRKGGYAKDTTPFSEFLWADFLRRQIDRKEVEKNFEAALKTAVALAKKTEADYLRLGCGPVEEKIKGFSSVIARGIDCERHSREGGNSFVELEQALIS